MSRDLQHAEETRIHAERVRQCLHRLGATPSTVKSAIGTITGNVQNVATGLFGDELIKNALTDYSAEHFEIAAYRALIEAAEESGHSEIVPLLKDNLREEQAMAEWLQDRLPELTRQSIARETAAH